GGGGGVRGWGWRWGGGGTGPRAGRRRPVTILTPPAGITSLQISPSMVADNGLVSGGLSTTQLPAISGAASAFAANLIGWLNGMMRPTTPYGSRMVKCKFLALAGSVSPLISVAEPA